MNLIIIKFNVYRKMQEGAVFSALNKENAICTHLGHRSLNLSIDVVLLKLQGKHMCVFLN